MNARVVRPLATALLGAFAGAAWLVLVYAFSPAFSIPMDRTVPALATGFYPPERNDRGAFSWTGPEARVVLDRLDRRVAWSCAIGIRGARPDPATLPDVAFVVDGAVVSTRRATNEFQRVTLDIPARPGRPGTVLSLSTSTVLEPGPRDARRLGVMVNELTCRPSGNQIALPPRDSLGHAALAAGLLGAGLGAIGITPGSAVGAAIVLGAAQARPLSARTTLYTAFPRHAVILAAVVASALVVGVFLADRFRLVPLRHTARFVAALSAGTLYLHLLVLLHPQRHLGVVPLTGLAAGHAWIAPIVVASTAVLAGMFLYDLVNNAWADRLAAASAVAFYNLAPIAFNVQARGDLAAGLADSLGVVAIAGLVAAGQTVAAPRHVAAVAFLLATAFLLHRDVAVILFAAVLFTAALCTLRGIASLRRQARTAAVSLALATLLATGFAYAFGNRGELAPHAADVAAHATAQAAFGWPILFLACVGAWRIARSALGDGLSLTLSGWLLACLAFLLLDVLLATDLPYGLVAYPAVSMLAAVAVGWAWRRGGAYRLSAVALSTWAVWVATANWIGWLR
jgi:hypothetical protein